MRNKRKKQKTELKGTLFAVQTICNKRLDGRTQPNAINRTAKLESFESKLEVPGVSDFENLKHFTEPAATQSYSGRVPPDGRQTLQTCPILSSAWVKLEPARKKQSEFR